MLLWGASAYLVTLVPRNLALDVGQRFHSLGVLAIAVATATTVAAIPLESAVIGEGWNDALDSTTIRAVLFETSVGYAWQVQAAAALVLTLTLAIPLHSRHLATALASGLALAAVSLTGHAVMQEGWLGVAHRVNDAVHVLSAGAWLGGLLALLPILKMLDDPERRFEPTAAVRRFSTAGHVAVALVIASGVINTVLVLGRWPTDWSSPYQVMLAIKIGLVAVMAGLAIINRYALVPRIAWHRSFAVPAIRLGTVAEITLGICVVGLVAVFGMLEPS
jgi:putative copper resistance protein D